MIKIINKEGKVKEEVIKEILDENHFNEKDIIYKETFIEGKLFKGSKYIIDAVVIDDIKNEISKITKDIGNLMNLNIESEILRHDSLFNVTLVSSNNNILIGRNGKTLNSIQTLIRQAIRTQIDFDIKINLDVANYKVKKLKTIEREIKKIAKEVELTKIDASLEPMNSYERRLVHNIIKEYPNLTTESEGVGKERHVVLKYMEK